MQQHVKSIQNLRLLAIFATIFFIIHGSWLFNFHGHVDDVLLGDQDWIILARGKWAAWLFKTVLSHGPDYPYGCIFYGLCISVAALLQCHALGLLRTWQRVAYATLLICSYQEISNVSLWMQNDVYALGILASSAAAYYLSLQEGQKWKYAIPLLTVSLGCYQTLGTYFAVLLLAQLLLHFLDARLHAMRQLFVRAAIVIITSLALYYAINKCMSPLVPESYVNMAKEYEGGLNGWGKFFSANYMEKLRISAHFGVLQPLRGFFSLDGRQCLFLSTLLPLMGLAVFFARAKKHKEAIAAFLVGVVIIYIPFLFVPLLMHPIGFEGRMMIAVPVSTACIWGIAMIQLKGHFCRHLQLYGTILLLAGVHALYLSGESARNMMFLFNRATEELREMYMLARVEAQQNQLNDCDFLFCGIAPLPAPQQPKAWARCSTDDLAEGRALWMIFPRFVGTNNSMLEGYSAFLRIGSRTRCAKEEDLAKHAKKLHQMPIWPADGSVAADEDVVLIKLGNEMKPGVPLP